MKLSLVSSAKTLNKAHLKQSLKRDQVETFKIALTRLFERLRPDESEEHLKNIVADFLKNSFYEKTNEINTSGRADLAIHNGKTSAESVGVLIEVKRPGNKNEMISPNRPNTKALHELLHYYMQERYLRDNKEIKHLIICNIYEWYVFDAVDFERFFFGNQRLVKSYKDWNDGLLVSGNTDWFYQEIAKPFIDKELTELPCACFDLRDFERIIRNPAKTDDKKLVDLYKLLSPTHLLKQPFANDSNALNKEFYNELLHIIGLEEVKQKGKKLIRRKAEDRRDEGSLLENTWNFLQTRGRVSSLDDTMQYGADAEDQCFSVALELCIIWLNRILFLNLLKSGATLCYIAPNKFMRAGYGKNTRDLLTTQAKPLMVLDFGDLPIFEEATTYPSIVMVEKLPPLNPPLSGGKRKLARQGARPDKGGQEESSFLAAPDSLDVPQLEAEIDRLVYELYGLTEEEIALVEGKR